ncbi:retrovirus-related pol polyprotein from transposon TNT 1-94 [Tanacetum coccineum]
MKPWNSTRMAVNMPVVDTNDSREEDDSIGKIRSSTHDGIKPMGVYSAAKVVDAGSYEDTNTGSKPTCGVWNGTMLALMQSGPNLFDDTYRTENGDVIDKVKNKYENLLVGYFIGKSLAFSIVQNYVNFTWGKFRIQKLMRSDDGIFLLKFANKRDTDLKEVIMAVPNEDETSYTREVISVAYKLQPQRCVDCKKFGHSGDKCQKIVREPVSFTTSDMNSDGFTKVKRKKNKGKKADQQPWSRHIDGIRLTKPKPDFYWQKTCANKSGADLVNKGPTDANSSISKEDQAVGHATVSKHTSPTWNEGSESDEEVDEVLFPEGNKFDDQFDIRLKGQVSSTEDIRQVVMRVDVKVIPDGNDARTLADCYVNERYLLYKRMINEAHPGMFPDEDMVLIFDGTQLEDYQLLRDYPIYSGMTFLFTDAI